MPLLPAEAELCRLFCAQDVCGSTTHLAKGAAAPPVGYPRCGASQAFILSSTIQSYRRLILRQRVRMTSPLRHLPMSERAAVRSQIRRASKLPRYPHGHVMETLSVDASAGHLQWDDFIETRKRAFARPFLGAIPSTKGRAAPFGNLAQPCTGCVAT